MQELTGRTAVVTGAAGAIGVALAARLAQEGMSLVLTDVDEPALDRARGLAEQAGADCLAVLADLADPTAAAALRRRAARRFDDVALLCNNAGTLCTGTSWQQSPETWRTVLGVNLLGAVNVVHEFLPAMIASGRPGHVLNTVGQVALFSPAFAPPASYTASKHALLAYTEVLHLELAATAAPIGVTALCPSGVRSGIAGTGASPPGDGPSGPQEQAALSRLRDSIATGADAREVADLAVDAVKAGRFWAFPSYGYRRRVEHRLGYVRAQASPTQLPPQDRPAATRPTAAAGCP